jgi:hypothetical protein
MSQLNTVCQPSNIQENRFMLNPVLLHIRPFLHPQQVRLHSFQILQHQPLFPLRIAIMAAQYQVL